MKTLLCCIGRRQNQYIREFVEYYKNLGFTNILLYDNNYDGEEDFNDAIGDYIIDGYVKIKNYRNRRKAQFDAYYDCWNNEKDEYDWIAFFDCDEFLTLEKHKTIDEFLSDNMYGDYNAIVINWMCFGDSNLVYNDKRNVIDRFTVPSDYDVKINWSKENNHVKTIIRCTDIKINFPTPHCSNIDKQVTASGQKHTPKDCRHEYDYSVAYIRHYTTKTIEEYCTKMIIGYPDQYWDTKRDAERCLKNVFFKHNTPTPEKIKVIKDILGIDMSYLLE